MSLLDHYGFCLQVLFFSFSFYGLQKDYKSIRLPQEAPMSETLSPALHENMGKEVNVSRLYSLKIQLNKRVFTL